MTEGWGQVVEDQRQAEAAQVSASEVPRPASKIVTVNKPIQERANISSDGGMILLREAGWKEVKLSVISEVKPKAVPPTKQEAAPETGILLTRHTLRGQAGLWSADEMGQPQYLEGARRQVNLCPCLTSVNDGAPWIERITASNYPQIIPIIDWSQAQERLWKVAQAAFGEGSLPSPPWVETQVELLWHGRVNEVVSALPALDWNQIAGLDDVRQSPAYFESRPSKMD